MYLWRPPKWVISLLVCCLSKNAFGRFLTGDGDFSCCGRKLEALVPKVIDENHSINIEEVENDYYIEINHEMTKEHFISFVAYVTYDRVLLIKLYPEQSPTVRFPRLCGKFERGNQTM